MIIERDKTNQHLFIASGPVFGLAVVAEGSSPEAAFTQYIAAAAAALKRQRLQARNHPADKQTVVA